MSSIRRRCSLIDGGRLQQQVQRMSLIDRPL